jgi:hypothetical protein
MPKAPHEIALAIAGEESPLDQMRNFAGTPHAPQKIALAVLGERTPRGA